ncbi:MULTISPECIES: SH3 domain-containing protein [unclassified Roseofilum]|uniref:SH3 domain-containing protein n=1 Tax=unclassified Roseofilum TaxID=2620099 RepID=UPI000E960F7C|nr:MULTISPECIES: SH3 domain-containing protein [unclassified Roseofilum]MBP0007271.1 SH3 domain-containing protein [Roseofilum sp. Belize Diploria]MBP0032481.1 SH3 domain-containing protein [Roseofilum sp. Belize BBD 4]HBR00953.1 hypothetical protein [Cyanobacteria bacterium UBA11691]
MKYGLHGLVVFGLMMAHFPGRSLPAIASPIPSYVSQAEDITGECRAAGRGTFIHYEPSDDSGKIRALQVNDRMILGGNEQDGWIAITEPTVGFVRTRDLKLCTTEKITLCASVGTFIYQDPSTGSKPIRSVLPNESVVMTTELVDGWRTVLEPRPGFIQQGRLKECEESSSRVPALPSRTSTALAQPSTSLCHRVTPLVDDGLNVRSVPTEAGTVVDTLTPGTLVMLRSTTARMDSTGRSWVSIISPVSGWVSDGFEGNKRNLRPISCGTTR